MWIKGKMTEMSLNGTAVLIFFFFSQKGGRRTASDRNVKF